jgi:ribosomal protein S27E
MKFWIEAIAEDGDTLKKCDSCGRALFVPDRLFCEFTLYHGTAENPQNLYPNPTGKFRCRNCAKETLI